MSSASSHYLNQCWPTYMTSYVVTGPQWRLTWLFGYFILKTIWSWLRRLTLHWRYNERDGVSNHRRLDCLHNRVFRCGSKKTSQLRVTGLLAGNSSATGEFPAQMASNAENASIWWRHHERGNVSSWWRRHEFGRCVGMPLLIKLYLYWLKVCWETEKNVLSHVLTRRVWQITQ